MLLSALSSGMPAARQHLTPLAHLGGLARKGHSNKQQTGACCSASKATCSPKPCRQTAKVMLAGTKWKAGGATNSEGSWADIHGTQLGVPQQ